MRLIRAKCSIPGPGPVTRERLVATRSRLAVALSLALPASAAWADCIDNGSGTVTCDNVVPSYSADGNSQLTINIAQNTSFNGPFQVSNVGVLSINNGTATTTGGNLQSVSLVNDPNAVFINNGNINGTFTISGGGNHFLLNYLVGGRFNGPIVLEGDGNNTIYNYGTLNPTVQVNGTGITVLQNLSGSGGEATMNGGIVVVGSGQTQITNTGRIQNGSITTGSGSDFINNLNGGTINSDVLQGDGNDTFYMSGGEVNRDIHQGNDNDWFSLTGGQINASILAEAGNDYLLWSNAGLVNAINMGTQDDRADFQNLTDTQLRAITIDGGLGEDTLNWFNTQGTRPDRLVNWELIDLRLNSQLTMGPDLVLGDSASGGGSLGIDNSSRLLAGGGSYSIRPAVAADSVLVVNGGTIDLTNGGNSVTDSLTVVGNYVGNNGLLQLNTVLDDGQPPSDKLVISQGSASGATRIGIVNVGGQGGMTTGDGILVVQAINGGTTTASAFSLAGRVVAGPYEYLLFRGGDASAENWYLRNNITVPPPPPPPPPPTTPPPPPPPTVPPTVPPPPPPPPVTVPPPPPPTVPPPVLPPPPPTTPPPPPVTVPPVIVPPSTDFESPDPMPIMIYRPEVPDYVVAPMVARAVASDLLGTFHEREGEQTWVSAQDAGHNAWMRVFGGPFEQEGGGSVDPSVDGSRSGIQVGGPVWSSDRDSGHHDRIGLAAGYSQLLGDVDGDILGLDDRHAGKIDTQAYAASVQWTHVWPSNGYLDVVGQYTDLDIDMHSVTGVDAHTNGWVATASIEAGYPWQVAERWQLEPQAQVYWSDVHIGDFDDIFGHVHYDNVDSFTYRLGMRLVGDYDDSLGSHYRPFLRLNIIHVPDGSDHAVFNEDIPVDNERGSTALQVGVGLSAGISQSAQLYSTLDYTTDLDGGKQEIVTGRVGVRWVW